MTVVESTPPTRRTLAKFPPTAAESTDTSTSWDLPRITAMLELTAWSNPTTILSRLAPSDVASMSNLKSVREAILFMTNILKSMSLRVAMQVKTVYTLISPP